MQKNFIRPRKSVLFLIFVFLLAYLYVGQIYIALGPSMSPTIKNGEYILVDKKIYSNVKPSKDDVVAFISPDQGRLFVKRVVAEEGDELEVGSAGIKVNSEFLSNTQGPWSYKKYTIEKNKVFVLGDNRRVSEDSRDFGPIEVKRLLGEVKFVVWPPSRIRIVK